MNVIFTCGGTAGHVNPAIAVAQLMAEKNPQIKILFVGAERGLEKDLIPKAGYEFRTVHISSFHRSLKLAEIKHNLVSLYNMVRSPAEARAILKDAPIVVLDEATASLDVENETAIQEALSRLIKNKTVLIIAHRMRTVAGADQVVVLSGGIVAEQGSPAELYARKGLYTHMVDLQSASQNWTI